MEHTSGLPGATKLLFARARHAELAKQSVRVAAFEALVEVGRCTAGAVIKMPVELPEDGRSAVVELTIPDQLKCPNIVKMKFIVVGGNEVRSRSVCSINAVVPRQGCWLHCDIGSTAPVLVSFTI